MRDDIVAIICPDIHGRTFWEKAAQEYDGTIPFIFLGDYLDPYSDEGITPEDAKKNFEKIWEFKKQWGDNVILLLGNHDISYYDSYFKTCRYCYGVADWYKELLTNNWDKFKFVHSLKNNDETFLFSHAGIHPLWLEVNNFEQIYDADYINSLFVTNPKSFNEYSYYRGGYDRYGSPIWCDVREFMKLKENKATVKQIIGHTQLVADKVDTSNVTCIDSRQVFVLTKNNNIEKY